MTLRSLAPFIIYAVTAALVAALVLAVPSPLFYSGDGGLKYWLALDMIENGYGPTLYPPHQPWAANLWSAGLSPVAFPFAVDTPTGQLATFPLPFVGLSSLLVAVGGWRAVLLFSLSCLFITWLVADRIMAHATADAPLRMALAALVAPASFAVAYGATFWEHTFALALAATGVLGHPLLGQAPVEESSGAYDRASGSGISPRRALFSGLAAGLATLLRPEALVAAAVLTLAAVACRDNRSARTAWIAGAVFGVMAFFAHNLAVYSSPLGLHAAQILDADHPTGLSLAGAGAHLLALAQSLATHSSALWALVALVVVAIVHGRDELRSASVPAALFVLYLVGVAVVVPNEGGKQWGPRYLIVGLPLLWLCVSRLVGALAPQARRATLTAVVIATIAGVNVNLFGGLADVWQSTVADWAPLADFVKTEDAQVVAVTRQHVALQLAGLWPDVPFVRATSAQDASAIAETMRDAGLDRMVWLFTEPPDVQSGRFAVDVPGAQLRCTLRPVESPIAAYSCQVVSS